LFAHLVEAGIRHDRIKRWLLSAFGAVLQGAAGCAESRSHASFAARPDKYRSMPFW
jgi:hypothetical protein